MDNIRHHKVPHGRRFIQQTDHKPLITIFGSKKGLPTANRLVRWGTILLNYNFKIEFLTSKNICHADSLSRLIPQNTEVFEGSIIVTLRTDCEIKNMIANSVKEFPVTLADIKRESREDGFTQSIKNKIHNKDPNVPEVFSLCDDVLLYNDRVVIPNSQQRKILRDFHMGHREKNRTKSLMCCYVYWPNMDRDIADMIESCKGCSLAAKSLTTMCKPWPKTDHPWQRIHVDFAGPIDNIYYLIFVDSHSKWPVVLQCKRPTTNCTIVFLHELFARFGVVDCVVTTPRNSHQVNSETFARHIKWTTLQRLSITPGRMGRPRGLWTP